jgi:prolyl 4-hydroxylase
MSIPLPMRFEDQPLLWTIDEVYTPAECRAFVEFIARADPSLATDNPCYRDQDRIMVDDPDTAAELYRRLRPHLPERIGPFVPVGLNERLRFYRYQPGQRFAPHTDHWYRPSPNRITLHSVLVYFNRGDGHDFEGGDTRFCEQLDATVVPEPGRVALFQHKIRHEGLEVRRGTKYAMRTDVVFEAPAAIGEVEWSP